MTTLLVTLPRTLPTAAMLCEGVLSDDGFTVLSVVQAPAALLPAPSSAVIVAVVPACRLSWHRLALPRGALKGGLFQDGNAGRLRAVLDGLLEDSVLDETSHLHFAIEPKPRTDEPVWVATCEKAWLHAWLAMLTQAGRPVARIVPELTPPSGDGVVSLHVTGTADQPQLMRTGPEGVTLLPLSVASAALMAWPEDAEVLAEPGVAELAEHFFNRPARLQTPPERWLAAAQSDWDLAQFDLLYTRGTRTRKHLSAMISSLFRAPRWRAARWASVALVLANVVGLQAWAWKEQSSQAAQRAAIRNLLTTTFPDVRVVVNAPVQMARALSDLQRRNGIASTADMETQLGHFKAAAPDTPVPAAIEFISTELRLKGLSLPASAVAEIAARLQAQGYRLRMDAEGLTMKEERFP
ncbi:MULTISPECIES: type II secretion system protein GspL [unclassified Polaromonas]|uniref:type II secretion system protein GspL n=1 Tax=unclassified Polaromonas TaxID=2638319 RepID=UPI0018C9A691|nr:MULTISPECIES: type II secretion system protein GspL [unclassified Polaromonas]MBG6070983.1 general secretion pathway protein L [Polaromonas sp. CG_9.7]MBG6112707.1 general secretion pathway protein L [Polaromonas sp. CG_9.2]MDH6186182.1 general secretion pathway protein L [Polaromonas sp. CG_23.6]